MTLVSRRRWWVTTIAAVALCGIYLFNCEPRSSSNALAQSTASPSGQRAALPKSSLPLQLIPGERIALVGNSLAERMNLFGHFEALLHSRFPQHELVVRNFARPCDAVDNRQRPSNYTEIDDPLKVFTPDTFLCFFGFNESFAGPDGRGAVPRRLRNVSRRDGEQVSARRCRHVAAVRADFADRVGADRQPAVAGRGRAQSKACSATRRSSPKWRKSAAWRSSICLRRREPLFAAEPGMQYTINGCHLNEAGDREVALLLDRALFGDATPASLRIGRISEAARRRQRQVVGPPAGLPHAQRLVRVRRPPDVGHRNISARVPEDSRDGGGARSVCVGPRPGQVARRRRTTARPASCSCRRRASAIPGRTIRSRRSCAISRRRNPSPTMKVPDGFEVQLFASEREFPELAKPNQLNFDNRGRLWVCVHADVSAVEAGRSAAERPAADLRGHRSPTAGPTAARCFTTSCTARRDSSSGTAACWWSISRGSSGSRTPTATTRPTWSSNCSTAGPATTRITRSARSSIRTAGCCTCWKACR